MGLEVCVKCGTRLILGENWSISRKARCDRLCKTCRAIYNKRYHEEHKMEAARTNRVYREKHKKALSKRHAAYYQKTRDQRLRYHREHKEEARRQRLEHDRRVKQQAMMKVSGQIKCVKCDCNDLRYLELHFINGGHTALAKAGKLHTGISLYQDILAGKVNSKLFEVMCRAHNAVAHFPESNLWAIQWKG